MKRTAALFLALALLFLLCSCGLSGRVPAADGDQDGGSKKPAADAADAAYEASPGFSVNGFVLSTDGEYEYTYNETGLCVSAKDGSGNILSFSYDLDEAGHPLVRYMEKDGVKTVFEKYAFDGSGVLRTLTVYGEDGEAETVWQYDGSGRAISGTGLPVKTPYAPFLPGSDPDSIKWDSKGRLVSVSFPESYPLSLFALNALPAGTAEEKMDSFTERLGEAAAKNGMKADENGLYLRERLTEEYEYDRRGRVTKWTCTMERSPLTAYAEYGAWESRKTVTEVSVTYRSGSVSFRSSASGYRDGKSSGEPLRTEFEYKISNSDGLPVESGPLSTDVYDALDCAVGSAEIGLFGVTWREGLVNYYGELHGGFAGLDLYSKSSNLSAGGMQSLRITGTGKNGELIEYTLWPDPYGRQLCQKFTDGLCTMPVSLEQDMQKRNQFVMTEDRDLFTYVSIGDP